MNVSHGSSQHPARFAGPGGPCGATLAGRGHRPLRRPPSARRGHAIGRLSSSWTVRTMKDADDTRHRQLTRRSFIRAAGVAGAGFVLYAYAPGGTRRAVAAMPGGTLDPATVPKFVTPLLIPPVMPRAGTITRRGGKPADYYEISVKQFSAADPARRPARDDRVGLRRGQLGQQEGAAAPPRALAHDRGQAGTGRCGSSGSTISSTAR